MGKRVGILPFVCSLGKDGGAGVREALNQNGVSLGRRDGHLMLAGGLNLEVCLTESLWSGSCGKSVVESIFHGLCIEFASIVECHALAQAKHSSAVVFHLPLLSEYWLKLCILIKGDQGLRDTHAQVKHGVVGERGEISDGLELQRNAQGLSVGGVRT